MKLYGAKCGRCTHIDHRATPVAEIGWMELGPLECADCSFCQNAALHRMIHAAGLDLFSPAVRASVAAFKRGEPDPLIDQLHAECQAIETERPPTDPKEAKP